MSAAAAAAEVVGSKTAALLVQAMIRDRNTLSGGNGFDVKSIRAGG